MFGQGALRLISTTSVAYWFDRQRGTALRLTSALGQVILSLAPLLLGVAVGGLGWRPAWLVAAAVVGSASRAEAASTRMFWAITGAVVTTGLIGTGLAFHQISILGEQGLTPIQAAANFIPQTVGGLVATLGTGVLVDRIRPRLLLLASMLMLATAILVLPLVTPGWSAAAYGAAVGASGGSARALEAAAFPRSFGTLHLGSIRGIVMASTVAGTASGPILLAAGHAASGSYIPVLRWSLLFPLAVAVLALVARPPQLAGRDECSDAAVGDGG